MRHLETEGYLVLKDVLPQDEVAKGLDLFWGAMRSLNSRLSRTARETWTKANFPGLFNIGVVSFHGLCQADFLWHVRLRPEVSSAFEAVHGLPRGALVSSMDAFALRFDRSNFNAKSWLHVDQLPHLPGGSLRSVQGAYNFYAVEEADAGLVVVPGSHLQPAFPPQELAAKRSHFAPLPADSPAHARAVKLLVPANSLVLWDSRLVHANVSETRDRPDAPDGTPQLNRLTAFVCMMPRALRSAKVLEQKREAYRRGRGTTHWATLASLKPADARWPAQRKPFPFLAPRLGKDGGIPPEREALM